MLATQLGPMFAKQAGDQKVRVAMLSFAHVHAEGYARSVSEHARAEITAIWDELPDFQGQPSVVPVRRREAAEFLGREMLNRRNGGRLLARHGGSVTALFLHLAAALREASCWMVSVGGAGATADLIESLAD